MVFNVAPNVRQEGWTKAQRRR